MSLDERVEIAAVAAYYWDIALGPFPAPPWEEITAGERGWYRELCAAALSAVDTWLEGHSQ